MIAGEGARGLATAFLFAGARNVLATLWNIDDKAASRFMEAFYGALFRDGLSAPSALREAQLHVRKSPGFESPYYWAPYILIGHGP